MISAIALLASTLVGGGIGYAIYSGAWIKAIAVAVLAVMAFPTAKKFYHLLAE